MAYRPKNDPKGWKAELLRFVKKHGRKPRQNAEEGKLRGRMREFYTPSGAKLDLEFKAQIRALLPQPENLGEAHKAKILWLLDRGQPLPKVTSENPEQRKLAAFMYNSMCPSSTLYDPKLTEAIRSVMPTKNERVEAVKDRIIEFLDKEGCLPDSKGDEGRLRKRMLDFCRISERCYDPDFAEVIITTLKSLGLELPQAPNRIGISTRRKDTEKNKAAVLKMMKKLGRALSNWSDNPEERKLARACRNFIHRPGNEDFEAQAVALGYHRITN